jgi:putative methionine-R-sulfoxide reductase with GAF domain
MANRFIFKVLKIDTLDPFVRWILSLPLIFAFASLLALVVTIPNYLTDPNWQLLVVMINNLVVMVFDLVSFSILRRGRIRHGAWLLLIITWWNLALTGVLYQGLGLILSVSAILLTILVMVLALSGRDRLWAILLGALVGYAIFSLDMLTAFPMPWRIASVSTQAAYAILIGMLVVAAIVMALQFRNFTLTGKLITSFLGTTVVVAVLLAAITQYVSQSRLRELIGSQLQFNAVNMGKIVGDNLSKQVNLLTALSLQKNLEQAIAEANASYTGSQEEIEAQLHQQDQEWMSAPDLYDPLIWDRLHQPVSRDLRSFHILFPDHVEVFVTDRYGAIVATTNRTSDYYQADEGWWQSAYKDGAGAPYIGVPEYDESSRTFAVNMAVPVRNDNNDVIGVMRTTYNVRGILDIINNSVVGNTGEFDLVIPGDPMAVFHHDLFGTPGSELLGVIQSLMNNTYLQGDFEGQASLFSLGPVSSVDNSSDIENLGWGILVHQTTQEAFSPVQNQLQVSLMIIYLLVGVMAVVGYGVSLVLSRPIVHLTRVAEKISGGDLTAQAVVESKDEIGVLSRTFNAMTGQLNDMVGTLEQRVADRTRALATTTEVSRRLSTILDQQELVSQVVEQVQSAFNYYHAHIYLYDEHQETLVMAGGTGEVGKTLLAQGHRIARGRGLVGRAAENNMPVLVSDTQQDPNWLPNPLLPDTRSEAAVPIAVGDTVQGVLDVQHNIVNGLAQADVDLLQSIASQVAIALQNARSFAVAQRRAEREALLGSISQKIRQAVSVDEALQVTARELGRVVGAPQTRVRLNLNVETNPQGE